MLSLPQKMQPFIVILKKRTDELTQSTFQAMKALCMFLLITVLVTNVAIIVLKNIYALIVGLVSFLFLAKYFVLIVMIRKQYRQEDTDKIIYGPEFHEVDPNNEKIFSDIETMDRLLGKTALVRESMRLDIWFYVLICVSVVVVCLFATSIYQ